MTIYIATIHAGEVKDDHIKHDDGSTKFLDMQISNYKKTTDEDYQLYVALYGNDYATLSEKYTDRDEVSFIDLSNLNSEGVVLLNGEPGHHDQHWYRMNYTYEKLLEDVGEFEDDDLLVFTDCDAWPIKDNWSKEIREHLEKHAVVSIQRRENPEPLLKEEYKPYPHASFYVMKAKVWQENYGYPNGLSWSLNPSLTISTMGPTMKVWLESKGLTSYPLLRTNVIDIHPLYFGVYGDLVYHHGAGTRLKYDSADIWLRTGLNPSTDLDLRYPSIPSFNSKVSELVLDEITKDDRFVSVYLLGKEV